MGSHGGTNAPLVQEVRRATERYQDVKAATAAGYALFLGCVTGPQSGAMGIHYANGDLVGDGIPAFYALHVWAWKHNPQGAFVDWNPRVSCERQKAG